MFDFRYHIVSLVAIFLALGIGILAGTMMVEKGVISQQEKAIIERLEADFDNLRKENRTLSEEVKVNERFQGAVLPYLVDGKLSQKNIAIVVTTNLDSSVQKSLTATFQLAGAKVLSTTTLRSGLGLDKKEDVERVGVLIGAPGTSAQELKGKILTEIATQLATAQNPKLLGELANLGVLRVEGAYDQGANAVVVIGGLQAGKSTAQSIDVPLLKALLGHNIPLAGTEASYCEVSYMSDYQRAGISTVDNIDSLIGQIALVYVLEGQSGNYGVKSTAQQILPAFKK